MKHFILLACILCSFAEAQINSLTGISKQITNDLNKKHTILKKSTKKDFLSVGYRHYKGKIGNNNTSIDLNYDDNDGYFTAFIYNDSLNNFSDFSGTFTTNEIVLKNSHDFFSFENKHFDWLVLKLLPNLDLEGFAINDSLKIIKSCSFSQTNKNIFNLKNIKFSKNKTFKKYPVKLNANIYFLNTGDRANQQKKVNRKLIDIYDNLLGHNTDIANRKQIFSNISFLKTPNSFETYCKQKFKIVYQHAIDKDFLADAHDSGHTDEFYNGLNAQILFNDGENICMQIQCAYNDGISYYYIETEQFQYNKKEGATTLKYILDNKKIQAIISNLKYQNIYTVDDSLFFRNPDVAFVLKTGIILVRYGGNHGTQPFYKFVSKKYLL